MNRQFNTPSPVVFPSASPTPKLYSTPSKKLPQVEAWQDNIGIESVPQQQNIYQHPFDHQQAPQQYNYSSREKAAHQQHTTSSISPLSVMMESDTLLDDEDISSYRFSEDEFLSSIISSSSTASSRQSSPLHQRHRLRRPVSYTSPSPLQQQKIMEEQQQEQEQQEEKPIVGIPFEPAPNVDPIHERMPTRRFSFSNDTDAHTETTSSSSSKNTKFGSFMSRFRKAATSGKSTSSLFK